MSQIHIDEVHPKGAIYPMIVKFTNGYTSENFNKQACMVLEDSKTDTKTIATELNGFLYAGEELSEDLGKTFILARNKLTGQVRIIETNVVNVSPKFHIQSDTTPLNTSNLALSRTFGSKKQKQRLEQREKLKVNVETVTEQMQKVTESITEENLDLSSYTQANNDDFYIPPINRASETVDGVYYINKNLTDEEYEKIYSELEGKDYTSDLIPLIKNIVSKTTLSPKCKVLAVYANSLLKLYSTMAKEIVKKTFTTCSESVTLNNIILNKFLCINNSKRTRPAPYKDKALCHAIVYLLLINNNKINFAELCEAVKLAPNTASVKSRVTGASITVSGSNKYVTLKLPLNKTTFRRKSIKS